MKSSEWVSFIAWSRETSALTVYQGLSHKSLVTNELVGLDLCAFKHFDAAILSIGNPWRFFRICKEIVQESSRVSCHLKWHEGAKSVIISLGRSFFSFTSTTVSSRQLSFLHLVKCVPVAASRGLKGITKNRRRGSKDEMMQIFNRCARCKSLLAFASVSKQRERNQGAMNVGLKGAHAPWQLRQKKFIVSHMLDQWLSVRKAGLVDTRELPSIVCFSSNVNITTTTIPISFMVNLDLWYSCIYLA